MKSFAKLKEVLMSLPVLKMSNFDKEFVVKYDTSAVGLGAIKRK